MKGAKVKIGNGTYLMQKPDWFDVTLLYGE